MACLSNLRQFGIAFVMYANDNEGYLPAGYTNLLCIRHDLRYVEPVRKSGVNFTVLPNPGGRGNVVHADGSGAYIPRSEMHDDRYWKPRLP